MSPTDEQVSIDQFWLWFGEHKTEIDSLENTTDPLWDIVLSKLHAVNEGLRFELSAPDGSEREFVITAESRSELFPIAEKIVKCAPTMSGWRVIALKPARGFAFTTEYEGIPLDPKLISFLPLENPDDPALLGLRIGVRSFRESQRTAVINGVLVILETALGERAFSTDIHHVELSAKPDAPEEKGYFPLPDLAEYIAWRKQKLGLRRTRQDEHET